MTCAVAQFSTCCSSATSDTATACRGRVPLDCSTTLKRWTTRTCDGFLAGTWPPLPTLEIERALGREGVYALEIAVGDGEIRKEESMGHGSGWRVDEHHHALLARVAAERDLGLRHDQPLIDRLARDEDWCWPEPRPDEAQAPAGGR